MLPRTPSSASPAAPTDGATSKRRGSYNCDRCGLPKRGHVCVVAPVSTANGAPVSRLRRALSFDDDRSSSADPMETAEEMALVVAAAKVDLLTGEAMAAIEEDDLAQVDEVGVEVGGGAFLPAECMVEIMRRLPPKELMGAAVCAKAGGTACGGSGRPWRSSGSGSRRGDRSDLLDRCSISVLVSSGLHLGWKGSL